MATDLEIPYVTELLERLREPIPPELKRWLQVEIQTVVIDSDAPTISINFTKVHSVAPNLFGQWDLTGAAQTERTSAVLQAPRLALTPYRLDLELFALPTFPLSTVPQLKIGPLTAPTIDLLTIPEVDFEWLKADPLDAVPRKAGVTVQNIFNEFAGDWKWTIVKKKKIADILGHGVYLPEISGDINWLKNFIGLALRQVIEVSMIPVVWALKLLRDMLIGDWIKNYKRGVDTVEDAINRVVGDLNTQIDNVERYINVNLVSLTNTINTNVAEVQDKVNMGLIKLRDGVVLGQQASQAAIEAANVQGERLEEAANHVNSQLQAIVDYMNDRIESAFKFVYDAQGFFSGGATMPTLGTTVATPTFAILNGEVPTTCPRGYVWDDRLRKCVPIAVPEPPPPVEPAPPPPIEPAPPPLVEPEPPAEITPEPPIAEVPEPVEPIAPIGVPALSITSPSSGSVPSAAQTIKVAAKDVAWITLFGSVAGGPKQDFGTQQTGFQNPDEIMAGIDPIGTTTRSFSVSLPLGVDVRFWANGGKFIFRDGAVVKVSTATSPSITIRYVTAPPAPPAPVEEIPPGVGEYTPPTPTSIPSPVYKLGPVPQLVGTFTEGKVETIQGVAKGIVKQLPKFAALVPLNITASGFTVLNPGRGSKLTYMALPFSQ